MTAVSRRRLIERVPLLLWTAPLAGLMVGAILAATRIDKDWAVALALVALVATVGAMAVVTRSFLLDEDTEGPPGRDGVRWPVLGLAAIAAASVVIAFLGSRHDDVAVATSSGTPAAAEQTVRDFLVAAYVDDDGGAACGYLSLDAQHQAAVARGAPTCRQALNNPAGPAALAAVTSPGQVRDLPARVTLAGDGATVRLGGAVFVLRPATAAERAQFDAAPGYWRIVSGATALLRAG
ncbi:MAG: hypothetical protein QOJ85_4962 [Solirubrobacteraceae bacterium]|nr:hypothetical protein [Solirubrobacteraceae bacterium]